MDGLNPRVKLRSILTKMVKDDYFTIEEGNRRLTNNDIHQRYREILSNINGFIIVCNYVKGLYEYVSEGIRTYLGYNVDDLSSEELTFFLFSKIREPHARFLLETLMPTVLTHLKENASATTGTNYRFSLCSQLLNANGVFVWYLMDTSIIQVDKNGFPVKTLITCTNIQPFKRDDCIYYNIMMKNPDGIYEVVLEGKANNEPDEFNLSLRETQIVSLISQGYSNKQIADKLFITINTVQTHRKRILKKLDCKGTADLTNFAISRGLC